MSGSLGRLAMQAVYFLLLANTLSLSEFGIFAAISAAGIMIGSFAGFGFSAAAFRAAATRRSLLGAYATGVYFTFAVSAPICMAAAVILYLFLFAGHLDPWSYAAITVSDILLWRLLEIAMQLNNGLGLYARASTGAMLGSGARLVAAVGFQLSGAGGLSRWAIWYLWCNFAATAIYCIWFRPDCRLRWRGVTKLIVCRFGESVLFAISFFVFYAQSELDKIIVLLLADARIAGIYSISMRVVDLTAVPVRSFLLLLVREIMMGRGLGARWRDSLAIEGWIGSVSTLGFAALLIVLHFSPNLLGRQIYLAEQLFLLMLFVPAFRNVQEYHAELFFAWNRMGIRATSVIGLTVLKALLVSIILIWMTDLAQLGMMLNGVFATTYVLSEAIVYLTFFAQNARPARKIEVS